MTGRSKPDELAALRQRWRQWTAIVEWFAQHDRGTCRVGPERYAALHHELMAACRSLAAAEGEVRRAFYLGLEDLAHPWLSPQVLGQADREILADLLGRCRQAEQELGCPGSARALRRWAPRLLALTAGFGLVAWTVDQVWPPLLDGADAWWRAGWLAIRRAADTGWLMIGGIVVIILAVYLIARDSRR